MSGSDHQIFGGVAFVEMTTRIVSAYAASTKLFPTDLISLTSTVLQTLAGLESASVRSTAGTLQPAVPIEKSITADFIICLEDGVKRKMLKRHLMSAYGMSPAEYRINGVCRATIRWSR